MHFFWPMFWKGDSDRVSVARNLNAAPALKALMETMTNEQKAAGEGLLHQMRTEGVLVALDKYKDGGSEKLRASGDGGS